MFVATSKSRKDRTRSAGSAVYRYADRHHDLRRRRWHGLWYWQLWWNVSRVPTTASAAGADMAINASLLTDFRSGYYRYNTATSKYDQGTAFSEPVGYPGPESGSQFHLRRFGASTLRTQARRQSPIRLFPSSADVGPQYGSGLNINRCNCPLAAARRPVPGCEQLDQDPGQPLGQVRRRSSLRA